MHDFRDNQDIRITFSIDIQAYFFVFVNTLICLDNMYILSSDLISWSLDDLLVSKFSVEDVHFQQVIGDVFVIKDASVRTQRILQLPQNVWLKIEPGFNDNPVVICWPNSA